jgi:hypothetical protein
MRRPDRDDLVTVLRQVILSTSGAITGLITAVPPIGIAVGALASVLGLRWRSPKERAQAKRIAELERKIAWTNSYEGDRERRKREATARRIGNIR